MDEKDLNTFLQKLLQPINGVVSPGAEVSLKELFKTRLDSLGLSQYQVEKLLNMERRSLEGILDRTAKRVDIVNALKLSSFLDLKPEKFLNIFLAEMPSESIGDLERARKLSYIVDKFDLKNLYKSGFIDTKVDLDKIEDRIKRFFGIESIFDYDDQVMCPLFSRTKRSSNNKMRDFWVKSAYVHFQKINNPNTFDRAALVDLVPKIRPYTMNPEKGLLIVAQALYSIGVTVIYQPHLPTVQVRGATFNVNDKPCIVLTDLRKYYPTLWFALMHEIHHVLYDYETVKNGVYHLTGELDLFLMNEDAADDFSREYLFSSEKSRYISPFINDELLVNDFAKKSQIHPSFVYIYYNYDRSSQGFAKSWGKYAKYIPDSTAAVKYLNTNPWDKETIAQSVEMVKKMVFSEI
jgi:HTH-type transcriptional regulator / antitoxin HigA